MKLLNFYSNNEIHLGIKTNDGIIDVKKTVLKNKSDLPTSLIDIIKTSHNNKAFLNRYLKLQPEIISSRHIKFAPSVPFPNKILCIGLNYSSHAKEISTSQPNVPTIFSKFNNSLVGHKSPIHLPKDLFKFDYEAELVIVIGKEAHNVSIDDAPSHIFGYSIGNDFSARDIQFITPQWLIGKSCDDFAPLGPYIVTSDEIDPENLYIKTEVNGVLCQYSNTKNMIFNCYDIVSYISKYITLVPGDVIYTGTPEGVILGQPKDKQVWLKPGDKIDITIEKIGTLSNTLAE